MGQQCNLELAQTCGIQNRSEAKLHRRRKCGERERDLRESVCMSVSVCLSVCVLSWCVFLSHGVCVSICVYDIVCVGIREREREKMGEREGQF